MTPWHFVYLPLGLGLGFSISALLMFGAKQLFVMETVLCVIWCWTASLASTHWIPVVPLLTPIPVRIIKCVSRHCQISVEVVGTGSPRVKWRAQEGGTVLKGDLTGGAFRGIPCEEYSHLAAFSQYNLGKGRKSLCAFTSPHGSWEILLVGMISDYIFQL